MQSEPWNTIPRQLRQCIAAHLDGHLRAHWDTAQSQPFNTASSRSQTGAKSVRKHQIVAGLPIYSASLGQLARKGISKARPGGWLLLINSTEGVALQVEAHANGKEFVVIRVSTGALANDLKGALVKAGTIITGRQSPRLQLRALRVSAMHIFCLWIHRFDQSEHDVLIPFTANFVGLRERRPYKRKAAERLLKACATSTIIRWYEQKNAPDE